MRTPLLDPAVIDAYVKAGWWGTDTLADVVARHAAARPEAAAFVVTGPNGDAELSWAEYHLRSSQLAAVLAQSGLQPGQRVGVMLPDGAAVHVAFVAAGKAGLTVAGIGARAGDAEVRHLLHRTAADALITHASFGDQPAAELVDSLRKDDMPNLRHIVIPDWVTDRSAAVTVDGTPVVVHGGSQLDRLLDNRALGPDDLFMLNSTSGTTGLPKCVMHTENRWFYFHQLAVESGGLHADDVFFGAVPAPFGFGLWTAHFSPALLGSPTVVAERFNAERTLRAIAKYRVTVLSCVSTQFIMMLNTPDLDDLDLSSLRVMFTGGEAVPYERAAAFEDRTAAKVLQFYGSNETGALSRTCLTDTRQQRFGTAGRIIDDMHVRVFGEDRLPVTGSLQVGIPACKGPATCLGYLDDDKANGELYTDDGWMLMGDIVEIDADGFLKVVGRTSDFIIRGGKNISAPAVEAEIGEHPAVALAAAVAMPDDVFGERVCVYVMTKDGASIELADIVAFLQGRGVSKEWFPERLVVLDELPRSSGGKVAKGELRKDILSRIQAERDATPA